MSLDLKNSNTSKWNALRSKSISNFIKCFGGRVSDEQT
jgi:hypothetical protein